jgi:ethanolamine transporter EutH
MALFDDLLSGWGSTVLIGVGVAIAAPVLLPVVGAVVRPVVKNLVKGGLFVADSLKELAADGAEQVSDLVAEAKAEYYTGASGRSV